METLESPALRRPESPVLEIEQRLTEVRYSNNVAQGSAYQHNGNVYGNVKIVNVRQVAGAELLELLRTSQPETLPTAYERRAKLRADKASKVRIIKLRPGWTSWYWSIILQRSYSGWMANYKTFNLVPYNSKIFELCAVGDLVGVRELLTNGQATALDVRVYDYGIVTFQLPLHVAIKHGNFELCEFLLNLTGLTQDMYPALDIWCAFYGGRALGDPPSPTPSSRLNILRLLVESFGLDCDDLIGDTAFLGSRSSWTCNDEQCLQLMQQSVSVPYIHLSYEERFENFVSMGLHSPLFIDSRNSFRIFKQVMGNDIAGEDLAHLYDRQGDSMLHILGQCSWRLEGPWSELCRDTLKAGANIHHRNIKNRTPLDEILARFFQEGVESTWDRLSLWLQCLADSGLCLVSYGKEVAMHDSHKCRENIFQSLRITAYKYGASPARWDLCLDILGRAETWRPLRFPGQWIDGDTLMPSALPWMPNDKDFGKLPLRYQRLDAWNSSFRETCTKTTVRGFIKLVGDLELLYGQMLGVQDDHGFISLEVTRESRAKRRAVSHGKRALSEPPAQRIHIKPKEFCFIPRGVWDRDHGHWVSCHRCARDGRWRLGENEPRSCLSQHCGLLEETWASIEAETRNFRARFPTKDELHHLPYAVYHSFSEKYPDSWLSSELLRFWHPDTTRYRMLANRRQQSMDGSWWPGW